MLESSGQLLIEYTTTATCPDCKLTGKVDAWADPELGAWGWDCPNPDCKAEHVIEDGSLDVDPGLNDRIEEYWWDM